MSRGDYVTGFVYLTAVLGLVFAAAVVALRRALPGPAGASRAVALGLLATLGLVAAHVLPLAFGILGRGSVLVTAALVLAAAFALPRGGAQERSPAPSPMWPTGTLSWVLAGTAAAAVAVVTVAAALHDATRANEGLDMVNFHLPDVASWIQSGTLWDVYQFVPRLTHGNYPNNGDMVLLSVTLPWRDDFLVRLSMLPFLALTAVAVYALARELRAPAGAAVLAAAGILALPIVAESGVEVGLPDPVMWATFAAGLLFAARHARTGATADLALAGLGLGLAFGTKWYGVSNVAIVLVVWLAARALARRPAPELARQGGALAGLVAACGGIWLVRNWVETGNPAFPVKLAPLGITIFDAPPDILRREAGFTIAGYIGDGAVWSDQLLPTYRDFLGPVALVLVIGVLAAAWVAGSRLRRRGPRHPRARENAIVLALAAIAALGTAAYAITPYSAQGAAGLPVYAGPNTRYVVPALLAAAPLFAWLVGRAGRREPWLAHALEAIALVAVLDGLRRSYDVADERPLVGLLVVGLAALAFAGARALLPRLEPAWRPVAICAVAVLLVAGLGAAGRRDQVRFDEARFRGVDATFDWIDAHAPRGHRVALAGNWAQSVGPPFPAFGPRLRNEVAYNGPWVDDMLEYYRAPGPFVDALRRGRYDLLVVGRGFLAAPGNPPRRDVREERWARAAGFPVLARSDALTLFAVPRARG